MGVFYTKHRKANEKWEENRGSGILFLTGDRYFYIRNCGKFLVLNQSTAQLHCSLFFSSLLFTEVCGMLVRSRFTNCIAAGRFCMGTVSSLAALVALMLQHFLLAEEAQRQWFACLGTHIQFLLRKKKKSVFPSSFIISTELARNVFNIKVDLCLFSR